MAFSRSHEQIVEQAAPDPVFRICPDPDPAGDLVRCRKSDPPDILGEPVGVCLHDLIQAHTISLPDPRSMRAADPVFLQKDHGIPQVLFILHLGADLSGDVQADAFYPCQLFRFLFHDPKSVVAEHFYDPGGHGGPDPLDAPRGQIAVHCLRVLRGDHPIGPDTQLFSIHRMGGIFALHDAAFAFTDGDRIADAGHDITQLRGVRLIC